MQPPIGGVPSRDDSGIFTGNDTTPSSRLRPFVGGDTFWKNGRHQAELRQQVDESSSPSSNLVAQIENESQFGKFAHPSTPFRLFKNEPLKEITDVVNNVVVSGDTNDDERSQTLASTQPSLDMKEASKLSLQKQLNSSFCNDSLPVMNINESLSHSTIGNKTSNDTFKSDDTSFLTAHDIQRPDFLTNRTFYDPEFLKTPGRNLAEIRIDESPFNPLEGFPDQSNVYALEHSQTPLQTQADQPSKETDGNAISPRISDLNGHPLAPEIIFANDAPVLSEFSVLKNNTNRFGRLSCSKQLPFDEDPKPPEADNMDTCPLELSALDKKGELPGKVESCDSQHKKFLDNTPNVSFSQASHISLPRSNGFSSRFSQTPAARIGAADSTWSNRSTDTFPLKSLNLNSFAKKPDVTYPSKLTSAKQSSMRDKDIFVMSVTEDLYEAQFSNIVDQTPKSATNVCNQSMNSSNSWVSGKSGFTNSSKAVHSIVSSQEGTLELMDDSSSHTTSDYTVKAAPAKPPTNNLYPNSQDLKHCLPPPTNRVGALPHRPLGAETSSNYNDDVKSVIVRPARPVQNHSRHSAPAPQFEAQLPHHPTAQPNLMANPGGTDCNNTSIPSVLKPQPQNVIRIKGVPYTVLSLLGKGGSSQVYQVKKHSDKIIHSVNFEWDYWNSDFMEKNNPYFGHPSY